MVRLACLLLVCAALAHAAAGADPKSPHPNEGVNPPFAPGLPKDLKLTSSDTAALAKGKAVQRQVVDKSAGKATVLAVQDVAAPVQVHYRTYLSFRGRTCSARLNTIVLQHLRGPASGSVTPGNVDGSRQPSWLLQRWCWIASRPSRSTPRW